MLPQEWQLEDGQRVLSPERLKRQSLPQLQILWLSLAAIHCMSSQWLISD